MSVSILAVIDLMIDKDKEEAAEEGGQGAESSRGGGCREVQARHLRSHV